MDGSRWFESNLADTRIMAILRGLGVKQTLALARTAWDYGINCVEVTIQSSIDADSLRATIEAAAEHGNPVAAGTVTTLKQVHLAVDAGAAFIVSPGFDAKIVREASDIGIPILPGVASATEIQNALNYGLTWLKVFPATVLGPHWFTAMHGPFPDVRFVATGGINSANAKSFLESGASIVAAGSALADPEQLPQLAKLTKRVRN